MAEVIETNKGPLLTSVIHAHALETGDEIIVRKFVETVVSTRIFRENSRTMRISLTPSRENIYVGVNELFDRVVGGRR
jgi:hypothetical protein